MTIEALEVECPVRRCDFDLQSVDGLLICTGCGLVPEECDCAERACTCCDDDGNHVHDDATCFHPCCPEAGE